MKCVIGFDGECYILYINDKWQEISAMFSDVKESAEKAGFKVECELDEHGHPTAQPICTYKEEA